MNARIATRPTTRPNVAARWDWITTPETVMKCCPNGVGASDAPPGCRASAAIAITISIEPSEITVRVMPDRADNQRDITAGPPASLPDYSIGKADMPVQARHEFHAMLYALLDETNEGASARSLEKMVEAARKHDRIVQVGLQRRSSGLYARLAELVRSGALGKITGARACYASNMAPLGIGRSPDSDPAMRDQP